MVIVLQMVVSEAKIVAWAATFNHIRRGLGGQGRLAGKYRGVLRAWAGGLLIWHLFWHNYSNQKCYGYRRVKMNKNVVIGLVLIALAGGGYMYTANKAAVEQAAVEAKAAAEAEAAAAAQKAADEAAALEAAAAEAKAAAEAEAAAQAAAAEAAAAEAATAVTDAASATADAATEAATGAADAMSDMGSDAMAALDPANFDATKITAMIDASDLNPVVKSTLKSGVEAAAADPSKVAQALDAVKAALGM
jgi:colicin import membrane protein